jgi:phenylpyruvate tautomerase PptA (4-oxalocrotonate tautomerase family)
MNDPSGSVFAGACVPCGVFRPSYASIGAEGTGVDVAALIEALTLAVHEVAGAPLDKIVVVINEIPRNRWGEGGVLGSNPDFPELSRRRSKA